jgi:hypothetical protein
MMQHCWFWRSARNDRLLLSALKILVILNITVLRQVLKNGETVQLILAQGTYRFALAGADFSAKLMFTIVALWRPSRRL